MEDTDEAIIRSVLDGDRDQFRHLVVRYQTLVFSMIKRQVGDPEIARDLAQETFIRAFRALDSFRGDALFSTWLTRIALNISRSYFNSRQFKERVKTTELDHRSENDPTPQPIPDQVRWTPEALEQLRQAIGQLKPIYREPIVLCFLERKTYSETAALLRIPAGTVCSRISTGLQQLRKRFIGELV